MKRHLDDELKGLHKNILRMAVLAEEEIHNSIEALKNRDKNMAKVVIDKDRNVDELELLIDEKCIDLIACFQPMAGDLRFITMALKINSELERIADLAVDIAQRVLEIADKPHLKPLIDIPKLSVIAENMVHNSIEAFVKRDAELAKKVVLSDSEADKLRNLIQEELISDYMIPDGKTADRAVPLLLIARHLERICDHATNIAENVAYMSKATVIKHHPEKLKNNSL